MAVGAQFSGASTLFFSFFFFLEWSPFFFFFFRLFCPMAQARRSRQRGIRQCRWARRSFPLRSFPLSPRCLYVRLVGKSVKALMMRG